MKVCFRNIDNILTPEEIKVLKKFVTLVNSELPLKKDVSINLLPSRNIPMTTGVRLPKGNIFVLVGNRMIIDVLRTLAHEWVHEFQYQKMGLKDNEKIQDIGGPEENMCNALSGIFVKRFEKEFPNYSQILYNEN
jgi:hypothetical protein